MIKHNPITEELIAPCGMNCAVCSRYLAYKNNLKRSQCRGCRAENKNCTYLLEKCTGSSDRAAGNAAFCFECSQYPCKEINRMDSRYRKNYNMSIKDNLDYIRKNGISRFIKSQYREYRCTECGGVISVHNRKCFKCNTITRLVEKINKKY